MKLSVVISVLNQVDLASLCYKITKGNDSSYAKGVATEFIIIDNGSDSPLQDKDFPYAKIVHNEKNIGVYPTFKQGMEVATGDVVAFLHSDVVIHEPNWNARVLETFEKNAALGLLGFVGSDEIDWHGGRGGGTMSNFMGYTIHNQDISGLDEGSDGFKTWTGSPAEAHGKRITDYHRGAVVDGCVMIIRRTAWDRIGYRENFPPHHFYDRLISTQMLEASYHVGVLGIGFDHISGQTVNQEKKYQRMAYHWLMWNTMFDDDNWNPNRNYDVDMYKKAEDMWLEEYREQKHIVPIKI